MMRTFNTMFVVWLHVGSQVYTARQRMQIMKRHLSRVIAAMWIVCRRMAMVLCRWKAQSSCRTLRVWVKCSHTVDCTDGAYDRSVKSRLRHRE